MRLLKMMSHLVFKLKRSKAVIDKYHASELFGSYWKCFFGAGILLSFLLL